MRHPPAAPTAQTSRAAGFQPLSTAQPGARASSLLKSSAKHRTYGNLQQHVHGVGQHSDHCPSGAARPRVSTPLPAQGNRLAVPLSSQPRDRDAPVVLIRVDVLRAEHKAIVHALHGAVLALPVLDLAVGNVAGGGLREAWRCRVGGLVNSGKQERHRRNEAGTPSHAGVRAPQSTAACPPAHPGSPMQLRKRT